MAFELDQDKHQLPVPAATALAARHPVALGGTSAILAVPVGTWNVEPFGVTGAASYAAGEQAAVYYESNIKKIRACASVGAGALVGVGSTNGRVAPIAVASGSRRFALGITQNPAADGEIVSVFIRPTLLPETT